MNLLPAFLRQRAWDAHTRIETERHVLLYLFLELTRRCNLRCRHCGSDCSREPGRGELDTASWLRIVDYLHGNLSPVPVVVLTGGEPLMHPGIAELARALDRKGMTWGMVTNGFGLDRTRLGLFEASGLSSVTVSCDGDRESHTWLRGHPEAYDRAMGAMELIGSSKIPVKDVVTCVFRDNAAGLDDTARRIAGTGCTSWRLFRIFPRGRAAGEPRLSLDESQTRELLDRVAELRRYWKPRGLDVSWSCEGYLPFALDRRVRGEPFFCRSGINIASILCDGSVTGCNNNGPEFVQGSVLERDFGEIWKREFAEYRDRGWMRTGACGDCAEWAHCRGGSVHLREKALPGPGFCLARNPSQKR